MTLSIFLAKIIGLVYLAAGIAALMNKGLYEKMIEEFEQSASFTFMMGMLTLVLGMLIIHHHNVWESKWPVLITVIGWIAIVKGFVLMAFPKAVAYFKWTYEKGEKIWACAVLGIGLLFLYWGFFS